MYKLKKRSGFLLLFAMFVFLSSSIWARGSKDSVDDGNVLVVSFWTAPNQGQFGFWDDKASKFNKTGTKINGKTIQIDLQMMPESPSSEAGIQNALVTGTAPAASTNINRGFAAILAASGRVYNLKEEKFFGSIVKARKMEPVLPGWEIEGGQYVIPLYVNAMGYHWNAKALKALGFRDRVPETMVDIENLIKNFYKLKDTVMKDMGVSHLYMRPQLMHPEWWWDRWFDFQMQYEAFSGGKNWVTGNRLTMDKTIAEKVFEFFGMFGSTLQVAEDWTAFEQEKVPAVFQVTAPWDIPKYNAAGKVYGLGGDYIYGPAIVMEKGDTPYTFADSKGIVFYKGDNISEEQHKGAVEFVKWCFTGNQGTSTDIEWIETTGMLPVRGDLMDNSVFQEIMSTNPAYSYLAGVLPYAIPAMAHEKMVDIQTALGEKGLTPYIQTIFDSVSTTAPDASSYIDAAFKAMIESGELD